MSKTLGSLSDAVGEIYQGFVLRDLLGFVLPGSLSLLSLWHLFQNQCQHSRSSSQCLKEVAEKAASMIPTLSAGQVLAFIGASYLTAWLLQSAHYGLVDWIFRIASLFAPHIKKIHRIELINKLSTILRSLLWPVAGIFYYAHRNVKFGQSREVKDSLSLITKGALAPDETYTKVKNAEHTPETQDNFWRYPERLSVLMVMTGNIAIAGILFIITFKLSWLWYLVILMIYLEYWRLWYTRNLQYEIRRAAINGESDTGSIMKT